MVFAAGTPTETYIALLKLAYLDNRDTKKNKNGAETSIRFLPTRATRATQGRIQKLWRGFGPPPGGGGEEAEKVLDCLK